MYLNKPECAYRKSIHNYLIFEYTFQERFQNTIFLLPQMR